MPEKDAGGGRETGNLFGVAYTVKKESQKQQIEWTVCLQRSKKKKVVASEYVKINIIIVCGSYSILSL